jgi:hypothetical protein
MRNKKGSMELSVNSIVILVIAIVIMGLILGFIRSKFAEVGGNLVTNEPEPNPASYDEQMTLSRETISTIPGGQSVLKVNVYNPTNSTASNMSMTVSCPDIVAVGTIRPLTVKSGYKSVTSSEQAPFIVTLSVSKNLKGSYLCTISEQNFTTKMVDITPKDFVLQIN